MSKNSIPQQHKVTHTQIVVYKSGKHHFEVAVESADALESYKSSSSSSNLQQVLSSMSIYTAFTKGQLASSEELRSVFDLKSNNEILDIILRQGTYHGSTMDKRAATHHFHDEVIQYIHDHYVNKHTKLPITFNEIKKILDDSKIAISGSELDREVIRIVHEILTHAHITLKEGDITGTIEMKADLVPQAMNVIHKYSTIKNETQTWFGDEMKYRVAIKPGDYAEFRGALDKLTKGAYKFEVGQIDSHAHDDTNTETVSSSTAEETAQLAKESRKAELKVAQIAKETTKQEIRANKQADVNRSRKGSGSYSVDDDTSA